MLAMYGGFLQDYNGLITHFSWEAGSGMSMNSLNNFHGLWENPNYKFNPPENEKIYFHNENHGTPYWGEWLEFENWRKPFDIQ